MLRIEINKNVDEFKDDFFKGFSRKETGYIAMSVSFMAGMISILSLTGDIPIFVSTWITMPVAFFICALGFVNINGLGLVAYVKKAMRIIFSKPLLYRSSEDEIIPEKQKKRNKKKKGEDIDG